MVEGQELTYDEIVHYIVSDRPFPNVLEVPNITLNEELRSNSEMVPRPKPWEKVGADGVSDGADELQIDLGRSDLPLVSAVSDIDVVSKFHAMETEFDSVMKDGEDSNA